MTQGRIAEVVRFLAAGCLNTAATYALYLVLLPMLGYAVAYTIAYAVGIALAYLLNTGFVFRVARTMRRAAMFPLVYLAQYVLGIVTLALLVALGGVREQLALLGVVALTLPVNFLLSRLILRPAESTTASPRGPR